MSDEKTKDLRSRNWSFIVYPESAPPDWYDRLIELCLIGCVSPLHDRDVTAVGEIKKAHYHVLLVFDGKKSFSQVDDIVEEVTGVFDELGNIQYKEINGRKVVLRSPAPMRMDSVRGAARYWCHLDNPDKSQYAVEMVRSFGGFDYLYEIGSPADKYVALREMQEFIDSRRIVSYRQFMAFCRKYNQGWFRALSDSCSFVISEYIKSLKWERDKHGKLLDVDDLVDPVDDQSSPVAAPIYTDGTVVS